MITINLTGDLTLRQQLAALRANPRQRARFHRLAANRVIKTARQNVRTQRTVTGQPMAPRKRGTRPMLKRLTTPAQLKKFTGPARGIVTWNTNRAGQIARAHQDGHTEYMTAQQAAKAGRRRGEPDYSAPATAKQAAALIKAGYRQPAGKTKTGRQKTRRISKAKIMETMTVGQAGLILRILRNTLDTKQSWPIELPARPFFGLNAANVADLKNELINTILTDVRRAA